MDRELLAGALSLRPVKASPARIAPLLKKEVPLRSVIAPKRIEGRMAGDRGAKAVNLGQLPGSGRIIYGLIWPQEKEISEIMTAPMATISKSKIRSSDLAALRER